MVQALAMAEDERAALYADVQRQRQAITAKQAEMKKLQDQFAAHKRA